MTRFNMAAIAALALIGCTSDKDSGPDDSGTTVTTDCPDGEEISAAAEYPEDGEPNFYYRSPIEFSLSGADSTATIAVEDSAGTEVAGAVSFSDDGETVYFTPSSPLTASTSYTATLTWCAGSASVGFTTSSLGAPLTADLTGRTYNVDITSGRFVEPAGVGDLLGGLLENSILLGVTSVTDSEISFRGALSNTEDTNQDVCNPSLEGFPAADFSEQPFFVLASDSLDLDVAGFELSIASINISGTFAADGSEFGGGVLQGELDARELLPVVKAEGLADSAEGICDLLIGFGVACEACSSDGEVFCATILVDQLVAVEQSGELQEVTQSDCFEGCADSCDNSECAERETFAVCAR